ncbi:Cof-type HAD-IIB family hydrolase [Lacrimispora sp.]|uniref:Cof-type HAD-IIB family hydrolase n=1 Tax=Lacrimispora sp. TaxID=2719234 RepID=UPI0028A1684D|nr:Cof-type HAD-IIB family hydrolase [Lacrimispora sp.]
MSVKAIVVDMDGTFLNSRHEYNRELFAEQYKELKRRGIHFIVASGRPYVTLEPYFQEIKEEITFIADGGAIIIHKGMEILADCISLDAVKQLVDGLRSACLNQFIISCKTKAFVNAYSENGLFVEEMKTFYKHIKPLEQVEAIDEEVIKLTVCIRSGNRNRKMTELLDTFAGRFIAISGGFGYLDVLNAGIGKANALKRLQRIIDVKDVEILAFGDSENDMELLQQVKWSVAMNNAVTGVKNVSRYIAASNDQDGVLQEVALFLAGDKYQEH